VAVRNHISLDRTGQPYTPNPKHRAGGLGGLDFPLLSDITRKISTDYGVLIPEEGVALRCELCLNGLWFCCVGDGLLHGPWPLGRRDSAC
jgi:hypothetical protein